MKLDPKTISILKSFSVLNPSMLFREGNVLTGVSQQKTVLSRAVVPDTFPKKFAVYEMHRFLGSLSLFAEPEIEFKERYLEISEGKKTTDDADTSDRSVKYIYTDESLVTAAPEKYLTLPSVDVEFKLTAKVLSDVIRAAGILSLPEIVLMGDGEGLYIQAIDTKNPTSDVYKIKLSATDKKFNFIFKLEYITALMSDDYEIQLSKSRLSYFKGNNIEYWIILEQNSTYDS